ncbi:MAG: very short patch repair endonuclease [Brevundimonas sp.]|uniref:very short patch repair endonuclease n=1 Tax=Brevundimonas sp. TaxID=1871086 RepID=UPI0026256239|nr:very short patch repair endonuclease [Brevundimonas sp.]MDI6625258.1 very short patch repair endonuclease [Brevundimonas sp.]MDQ7813099.1 very short patch repair endonuclease [Brevundimonas sp.]
MTDVFTPEQRSAVMRRVKGRDTGPELAVRRILRAAGIGYRLGGGGLPGKPDLVMKGRRTAVFVHGCFWHGHDCARGARQPKANAAYWTAKIDRNRARDAAARAALEAAGWRVVTVWECGMKAPDFAVRLVAEVRDQAAAVSTPASSSA